MAIVSVRLIDDGGGDVNEDGVREYEQTYQVLTNNALADPLEVTDTTAFPLLFSSYVSPDGTRADMGATLRSITPRRSGDDPLKWLVRLKYSSSKRSQKASEQQERDANQENPFQRPPDIDMDFEQFQRPLGFDPTALTPVGGSDRIFTCPIDKAAVNSAGDKFDPPPMVDDDRLVIRITRNQMGFTTSSGGGRTFDLHAFNDFNNSVNEDPIYSFSSGSARLKMRAKKCFENGVYFWSITYLIAIRDEGWDDYSLDQGYKIWNAGHTARLGPPAVGGVPVTGPAPLDGNGAFLAQGANPIFIRTSSYKVRDWAPLGLEYDL